MLATRQPTHQTVKPLTLYKRLPLKNKRFQALLMLKPLFIKRKQLNFQKHIDRAKTNPARQSPRAGLFARRSAPSRRFCARAGARCVSVHPAGARAIPPATCCCTTNWMSIKKIRCIPGKNAANLYSQVMLYTIQQSINLSLFYSL